MSFQADLAMVERLLAWVEWRVQVLKDDPILMEMIRVVKADPVGLRDKYQSNAEEHSMIEGSKEYGRVFFGAVGNTLITNQWDTFECSKPEKIGALLEGLLYYGLLVDNNGKSIAIECFFFREGYEPRLQNRPAVWILDITKLSVGRSFGGGGQDAKHAFGPCFCSACSYLVSWCLLAELV